MGRDCIKINRKRHRLHRSLKPRKSGIVAILLLLAVASLWSLGKDNRSAQSKSDHARSLENLSKNKNLKDFIEEKHSEPISYPSQIQPRKRHQVITSPKEKSKVNITPPVNQQNPHGGAFVHIGKTGGSTLSILLRNGCHSFMRHPCREIQSNESMASKLIESYYHVPDFGLLRQSDHDFYLITLRDPFDRTVSAFVYDHFANRLARNDSVLLKNPIQKMKSQEAFKCFPTLQDFAEYLGEDSSNFQYPYPRQIVVADSCTDLARAALHGRVKFFGHFYFSMQRIWSFLPEPEKRTIYVTRQEHLWDDWKMTNEHLGQASDTIFIPEKSQNNNRRNSTALELQNQLPVKRFVNDNGRQMLCQALEQEYKAYFWFLNAAKNLNAHDVQSSIERAKQNCPQLLLLSKILK